MDINTVVSEITDRIEKFNNLEKISWYEVIEKIFNDFECVTNENKNLILFYVVKEISKRGYVIEDYPFRLVK